MTFSIHSPGLSLAPELRRRIERRFDRVVGHGAGDLQRVTVRLHDINGPRGGADKRCSVELRFARGRSVWVRETAESLLQAVARAAGRARRVVRERGNRAADRRLLRRGADLQAELHRRPLAGT